MDERELRRRKLQRRRRAIRRRRILIASMILMLLLVGGVISLVIGKFGSQEKEPEQNIADENKEPETEEEEELPPKEAVITIAGDICFAEDGYVLDYYDTVNDLSKCISPELLEMMRAADVFYLNHEFCIGEKGTASTSKTYTFQAKPERMDLLKEMGVDLVALANNHIYDYGPEATIESCDLLDAANIAYVGGGRNIAEAKRPIYFEVNGLKIGFVAASNAEVYKYTPQATETEPGILRAYDMTEYLEVVRAAAQECDYLIAYMHWGTEGSNDLNPQQQSEGRQLLDAGADIVVGGHPHVLQGMEYVDGKPIVYSMGDFWFNGKTKYTGLLQLKITENGLEEMSFVPCQQADYRVEYFDEPAEQEAVYSFLEELSINIEIDEKGMIHEKK